MPFINSKVTVKITDENKKTLKDGLEQFISLLGKSSDWLMLEFEEECELYFRGEDKKVAFVEVKLFGKASSDAYNKLTAAICGLFEEVLGISQDKIFVKYEEVLHWGWNGRNF